MFNTDDIAMQGFKNIEEAAEPWAQPKKKAAKPEEKPVEEVQETQKTVDASTPFEEQEAEKEAAAQNFEEEYAYDNYMDPDAEYTYDDHMDSIPESAMPATEEVPPSANAERDALVEGLCRWGAARAGAVVVIPAWGAVGLIANEVYMIMRIARAYDVQLSTGAATAAISSLGATFVGQTIATLVPFPPLKMPIAISVTYGFGKAVAAWLEAGRPGSLADFKEVFDKARNHAANNVAEFANLDCKDVPLGDETKKAPLSERAFDAFGSGLDYTGDKLTDMFGYLGNTVAEKLQELKEEHDAKVEAEKDLPEEERSFYANARDNFDKNVEELQTGLAKAAEQARKEFKEALADTAVGKLIVDKEEAPEEHKNEENKA